MLNVPTAESERSERARAQEDEQQNQALQRRRQRRRPLSGDRVQGWADVRKLEPDGTGVEKYQVNLNTTAQLSWAEWQLMCDAEPNEVQDATWCIIPGDEEHFDDDDDHDQDADAMDTPGNAADTHRTQDDSQPTRHRRASSASSNSSSGSRFVRRQSGSQREGSAGDEPREQR